jgi:YD repeat-containing protein
MNRKIFFLVSLMLLQTIALLSQRVEFTYDDNGNRLTRTIIIEQLKSNSVQFPVLDSKSLKTSKNLTTEGEVSNIPEGEDLSDSKAKRNERIANASAISEDNEIITIVYPNPSNGLIKIDISNMPMSSKNEMRLYNLSGLELIVNRNFDSHTEIDISNLQDGIYILRIKINERVFDWKVVKNQLK